MNPWSIWLDPWEGYLESWSKALGSDIFRLHGRAPDDVAIKPGATEFRIVLDGENFALLDFSRGADHIDAEPTLIVTPYALHDWRVADLAHHHSLVETLIAEQITPLYVLAWKSADFKMRHNRIDAQFAALKIVTEYLSKPLHCVGLCQGGWLSLAFAARFRERISKLALIGTPVDFSSCAKTISAMDDNLIDASINWLALAGGGIIRGWSTQSLWNIKFGSGSDKAEALQESDEAISTDAQLSTSYEQWDREVLDLPPAYFGDVLKHLYRDNDILAGRFKVLGEHVSLRSIQCPILIMIGRDDDVAPEERILSLKSAVSTPPVEVSILYADCGHLALFLGKHTLENQWPKIAKWLQHANSATQLN